MNKDNDQKVKHEHPNGYKRLGNDTQLFRHTKQSSESKHSKEYVKPPKYGCTSN